MMEYKVVKVNKINRLEEMVNLLISKGWKPLGGVSVSSSLLSEVFVQALVRNNKP